MIAYLVFVFLLVLGIILPIAVLWRKEGDVRASFTTSDPSPLEEIFKRDGIAVEARLSSIDLNAGTGKLYLQHVFPLGKHSVAPEQPIPKEAIDFYVNSIRTNFPAFQYIREFEVTFPFYEGDVNGYPFDTHYANITFFAATTASINKTIADAQRLEPGQPFPEIPPIQPYVGIFAAIQSYQISANFVQESGAVVLEIVITRSALTKFFSLLIVLFTWFITISMLFISLDIFSKGKEVPGPIFAVNASMLFALPALRGSQPAIGTIGTLADLAGFYPCIILVSLTFVSLTLYNVRDIRNFLKQKDSQP